MDRGAGLSTIAAVRSFFDGISAGKTGDKNEIFGVYLSDKMWYNYTGKGCNEENRRIQGKKALILI